MDLFQTFFDVELCFSESENEVFYYTTYEEFKHVLSKLDHLKYEMVLCEVRLIFLFLKSGLAL